MISLLNWCAKDTELNLRRLNPKQRKNLARKLRRFSLFIREFPKGNRASNIEIAIAGYEVLTKFFPRYAFPKLWSIHQNSWAFVIGSGYRGDREENLKSAISFCKAALQVRTREAFPEDWAMTKCI
jgi:hypothetical protein